MHISCANHPTTDAILACMVCNQLFCRSCIAPQVIQIMNPEWVWKSSVADYVLMHSSQRVTWMVCHGCMAKMPPYLIMAPPSKPVTTNTAASLLSPGLVSTLGNLLIDGSVTTGTTTIKWNSYPDCWGTSPLTPAKKQTRRGRQHRGRNVLEEDLVAFLEADDAEG